MKLADPTQPSANPWDDYADEYDRWLADREPGQLVDTGFPAQLLDLLGDVSGKDVLDAGCGQGYLSRMLVARGARVTGIDLSPRLIQKARDADPNGRVEYRLADLSQPLPELDGTFATIACYLALNDVRDYRGFASTLEALATPGARIVLGFNNPYSSVVREHVPDYFAEGAIGTYFGMWEQGIKARYYHRTLEQYLDAFLDAGLRLVKLVDVPEAPSRTALQGRFPRFMILAFEKP